MVKYYNKDELKEKLEPEQIFDLLDELQANPTWTDRGIVADTICHNKPNEGSHKLYYYYDTKLCHCYTDCDCSFDIFDLIIKAKESQDIKWELYDAMRFVASYFGLGEAEIPEQNNQKLKDWNLFTRYNYEKSKKNEITKIKLKEYNPIILTRFIYPRISHWEKEGILDKVIKKNLIGYYPGNEQITIPHFDIDGRLIGIRGRTLSKDIAEKYGKYLPLFINNQSYSHPLSMNLYNLNNSKENIKKNKKAIIFESEKSTLQFQSFYGEDADISVACCGSNISTYQIQLLKELGVEELIVGFDRQFIDIGDEEFKRLKKKLINMYNKYNNSLKISAIFDKEMITPYKASPTDISKEVFEYLLNNRIIPKG